MRRGAEALVVALGVWLAWSPWFAHYAKHAHATQDTVVGILVALAGVASLVVGTTTAVPLWVAFVLGVWIWATPMMFGQAGWSFSADNDLLIGACIALAASIAIASRARAVLSAGPPDPQGADLQTRP